MVLVMKNKPQPLLSSGDGNAYAMAVEFPLETDRIFDKELNLLLMDG
jgi:hypothetical protein